MVLRRWRRAAVLAVARVPSIFVELNITFYVTISEHTALICCERSRYIPETLHTPVAARPTLTWSFPLEPLIAMRDKSVGILCYLNLLNHAMIYMTVFTVPLMAGMLTPDPAIVGVCLLPCTCGIVLGSMFCPKIVRGGREYTGVWVGLLLNILCSASFGWFLVSLCADAPAIPDDYRLHPQLSQQLRDDDAGLGLEPVDATDGGLTHAYNAYSMRDLNYRLSNELRCEALAW
eukprot:COSAG05_NODE_1502_length_4696_cov_15.115945_3_plen_233_part_00